MASVGDLCIREVVVGHTHERVVDVARRMREYHVGSVVIVDEEARGRVPRSLITDRDIVMGLVAAEPQRIETMTVGDLNLGRVLTASEDEEFYEVLLRMRGYGVRRFPIVDREGVLCGIVSFDDLVMFAAEQMSRLSALVDRERRRERERFSSIEGLAPERSEDTAPPGHLRWR